MHKIALALLLVALAAFPAPAAQALSVGVKKGNWIEYRVAVTGDMPDHDAQWARMDIMNVQGTVIDLNMTTLFTNGTYLYENITLNLETGQLGDDFFIPSNLSTGDSFYDAHIGNIAITGSEQRTYAGAERTVLLGSTNYTTFVWDKHAGILLEAYSNYPSINFTMKTVTDKTNMWQPQTSNSDLSIAYATIAVAIAAVVISAFVVRHKKLKEKT